MDKEKKLPDKLSSDKQPSLQKPKNQEELSKVREQTKKIFTGMPITRWD